MRPIYEPRGAAREYGELALNIYTGCPHRCYYCFAPNVLHREREKFHLEVKPRENLVEETRRQLERERITNKLIHLCFTCDPYPVGRDTSVTREIIKLLKDSGNHVQILTKGCGVRDFDLLDSEDWYGVTVSCTENTAQWVEPGAHPPMSRLNDILVAKDRGIKTWVSFEPVIEPTAVYASIKLYHKYIDKVKIGKLNYHKSDVDWIDFAENAIRMCESCGLSYYIKDSLRKEMEKSGASQNSGGVLPST